jgi:Gametolysin peptidase M11
MAHGLHADDLAGHRTLPAPTGIQSAQTLAAVRTVAGGPRTVAVIMFNFASLPATPWTVADVRTAVFTGPRSLNAFETEQSQGTVTLTGALRADGDVFGWYTIPQSTSTCDPDAWMVGANAAAAAAGVDLNPYQHRIYVFPRVAACGWSGAADMPGRDSFLNGTIATRTLAHEFGHNLGAEHASSVRCTDTAGVPASFSASCVLNEYGDPYDVMGTSERHVSAFRKVEAGFAPPAGAATITQSGTYRLASSSVASTGVTSLRVRRGSGADFWYLDLRSPAGAFENVAATDPSVTGVTVRLAGDYRTAMRTRLVDATPQTTTLVDAPFQPGQQFEDPTSGTVIRVDGVVLGEAVVSVMVPGTGSMPAALNPSAAPTVAGPGASTTVMATATLKRVSAHTGQLRIVVPMTSADHSCSVRVWSRAATGCRVTATRATLVRTISLGRSAVPVQVRVDGKLVISAKLRVPAAGRTTRLTKALSLR